MHQSTSSSSPSPATPNPIADVDKVSLLPNSPFKPLSMGISDDFDLIRCTGRCESDGEKAPDRLDGPLKTPQTWESELSDFDFTASPGVEEWQISENADGRAVYSTVGSGGAGVTVEFQKWDW